MRSFPTIIILTLIHASIALSLRANPEARFESHQFTAAGGETVQAEIGEIDVPENRQSEDSRMITLRFVRFKSTSETPGSPIVYLAGGPGGSGISAARGTRFPLFMAMREFGDVIAFDQRGTGMSGRNELACDERYTVPSDKPTDRAALVGAINDALQKCMSRLRKSGVDVAAYTTRESAADLNALRQALGAEKITLWGISYGTHLALATMKAYGDHVDRVILAGLEGLDHTWKLPSDQQALLEEIARLTAKDRATNERVPDLLGSIERILATLEKEPQTIQLTHPANGATVAVTVGKFDLQAGLASLMGGPETFSMMPDLVHRLENGDWTALALLVARGRMGEAPHAMSTAMDCSSSGSEAWMKRIAEEAETALLADAINFPPPEICEGLGLTNLGDDFRMPVESDIPALLISGTLDGRTPVANGEAVAKHLKNAQHLIIDGAGHSDPLFLSSPKILEAMQSFMRGKRIASARIELPPVSFITPRTVVPLDAEILERYVGTYEIAESETRSVLKAGSLLFTRRGNGAALPIRPTSGTTFFYERSATHLEFELGENGEVVGMILYQDGAEKGERARKVK
jgi:pimeloyl-ACP methyl ester carboxylesterase